jgi:hypothetical protein
MELLTGDMPLILKSRGKILCWGDSSQKMEFTHTHNIAAYTARVAVDDDAPRYLKIAGDIMSADDFLSTLTDLTAKKFSLLRPGGIGLFNFLIKVTRFFSPGKTELYPPWQGMQYMRDMMEGRVKIDKLDNERYPDVKWINIPDYLRKSYQTP